MTIESMCVFCGAQNAVPQEHLDIGWALGKEMAKADKKLVYGGGDCGVMGRIANAILEEGGWVSGVFPRSLRDIENEHESLSEIIIVDTSGRHKQEAALFEEMEQVAAVVVCSHVVMLFS